MVKLVFSKILCILIVYNSAHDQQEKALPISPAHSDLLSLCRVLEELRKEVPEKRNASIGRIIFLDLC